MFLWRLAKHSLPTKDVRHHRNMSTTNSCGMCGSHDSWRHSLLDCTMSRCIWALVDGELADQMRATSERAAKPWLFLMIQSLSHAAFLKLAVTLWAIWTARRKAIHEGEFQSPAATHAFINRYLMDLEIIKSQQPARPYREGETQGTTDGLCEDSC